MLYGGAGVLCSVRLLCAENSGNHFKCDHCHHDSGEKCGWVCLGVSVCVTTTPWFLLPCTSVMSSAAAPLDISRTVHWVWCEVSWTKILSPVGQFDMWVIQFVLHVLWSPSIASPHIWGVRPSICIPMLFTASFLHFHFFFCSYNPIPPFTNSSFPLFAPSYSFPLSLLPPSFPPSLPLCSDPRWRGWGWWPWGWRVAARWMYV